MKKLIALFAGMFLITLSANVFAQASSATVAVTSSAEIITPISIALTSGTTLEFGKIAANVALGGTVTVSPTAVRSNTGGTSLVLGKTPGVPTLTVSGINELAYSVTLPANNAVKLTATGAVDMPLTDFVTSLGAANDGIIGTTSVFTVGATLNVNANQKVAVYNGTFDVIVDYN